jgi:hypothetical protein
MLDLGLDCFHKKGEYEYDLTFAQVFSTRKTCINLKNDQNSYY